MAEPLFEALTQVFWYFSRLQEAYSFVIIAIMRISHIWFQCIFVFYKSEEKLTSFCYWPVVVPYSNLEFSEISDLFVDFLASLPMSCYGPRYLTSYVMFGQLAQRRLKFWLLMLIIDKNDKILTLKPSSTCYTISWNVF